MNNENFDVQNTMIPIDEYPFITADEPIRNGLALILQHSSTDNMHLYYEDLIVIDNNEQLVGMLDAKSILKSIFPSLLGTPINRDYVGKQQTFTELSVLLEDHFRVACQRRADEPVIRHMRVPHRSIDASMHVLHALEVMIKDQETTLPVTEDGILLGAVRITDIFRILGAYCST